jgi:hypothetical protein
MVAKLSARRKRAKTPAAPSPRAPLRHDENETADDRFLRAAMREGKRREWIVDTLRESGAIMPSWARTAERIMDLVDAAQPSTRGADLEGAGGGAVFDPGDPTDTSAGALGRVSGAHHAMLKRGHIARELDAIRSAVRAVLGTHEERVWWFAFHPSRPSLQEFKAACSNPGVCRSPRPILCEGLEAARAHFASLRRNVEQKQTLNTR